MVSSPSLTILMLATLGTFATAPAQGWRKEQVREVRLEFDAPGILERIPQRLGGDGGILAAKLQPKEKEHFIDGRMAWVCEVLAFGEGPAASKEDESEPEDPKEAARRAALAALAGKTSTAPKSFREWIEPPKAMGRTSYSLEIDVEGKEKKGRGGKLDYTHWMWRLKAANNAPDIYGEAAVYDIGGREVALAVRMPLEDKKHTRPSPKWRSLLGKLIKSGRMLEIDEDEELAEDRTRDRHADTPARQEALAAAKANIAGLKGWDYFTTEHYIVMLPWDYLTSNAKGVARKQAKFYSSRLEKMRDLYVEYYPLDETGLRAVLPDVSAIPGATGPVTGSTESTATDDAEEGDDAAGKQAPPAYPVFRLCATYDQFRKYGESPPGVVGWFSPVSKELVVFLGGDEMMGDGATEAVTYHEGWHQFADLYFNNPDREKKDSLHRWFDEAHGDFFGSHQLRSASWRYEGSKMRYDTVVDMVERGGWVAFEDITSWPRQKFYSREAARYYAQAWSMIDFLRRGSKLGNVWKERYATILDDYKNVMLVYGDRKRAVATAFRDFTADDWRDLENAWKEWVQSRHFRGGR